MKLTNNEGKTSAEPAEGRAQTKENDAQPHTHPTQSGARVSQGLSGCARRRIKQVAKLTYSDQRTPDFWEGLGYDWYGGL